MYFPLNLIHCIYKYKNVPRRALMSCNWMTKSNITSMLQTKLKTLVCQCIRLVCVFCVIVSVCLYITSEMSGRGHKVLRFFHQQREHCLVSWANFFSSWQDAWFERKSHHTFSQVSCEAMPFTLILRKLVSFPGELPPVQVIKRTFRMIVELFHA